ncbi:MAG: hypothetical protein ACK57Q_13810 [Planctomycetota bacterium]
MNAFPRVRGVVGVSSCAVLDACLSTSPALPPVRWFDPLPAAPAAAASPLPVRATAAPHLRQPFAVRVGAREFALDAGHQWVDEPSSLCAAMVGRALAGRGIDAAPSMLVEAFELDVTAAPRAHVRLVVLGGAPAGVPPVVDVWAAASDRSPVACAEAMAQALAAAAAQLAPAR